jgi:hypothetical protein
MSAAAKLPPGDPGKGYWTYADIAARIALCERAARDRVREWGDSFPQPLPYSRRELRWHPPAVLAFLERCETAAGARAPRLHLIQGGRRA